MAQPHPHNIAPVSRSGPPRSDGAEREEAVTPFRLPQPAGDSLAAQQRVINALLEDLQDRSVSHFPRVAALRREMAK